MRAQRRREIVLPFSFAYVLLVERFASSSLCFYPVEYLHEFKVLTEALVPGYRFRVSAEGSGTE